MAHQVIWTKRITDIFYVEAHLSDFEIQVMETRVKGMTITEQSVKFNCSKSMIDKTIKKLKAKYDECQKNHPEDLPERKSSAKELYMDTH